MKKDDDKTKVGKGNWNIKRGLAAFGAAAVIVPVAGGLVGCSSEEKPATFEGTQELAQLDPNSTLVQGREGCIKALIERDLREVDEATKKTDATKTCDEIIAQARAQPGGAQNNRDENTHFMLSDNGPPVVYYQNPMGEFFMWYALFSLTNSPSRSYYGYDRYDRTTINNYTTGPAAKAPAKLSPTQTEYLKASPAQRPAVASKAAAAPGAKRTTVTSRTSGSTSAGSSSRGGMSGPGVSTGG